MPLVLILALLAQSPKPPATDLDRFMVSALQRRDVDRQTLSDYILDEVEVFEILGPSRAPVVRMRREYTWYERDGLHVRSPVKADGVPVPESERRAYEEKWIRSEESRRKFRTTRDEMREKEGKPAAVSVPSLNEPRFVSEAYFMDFKFEPGNYYLAGKEAYDGREVLKIDYLPSKMFDDHNVSETEQQAIRDQQKTEGKDSKETKESKETKDSKEPSKPAKEKSAKEIERERQQNEREKKYEDEIERKMDKTSQITLWVDPKSHQIVKYTFDNVWLDFLPAGWLVKVDDIRAQMEMGQPFPDVWLPKHVRIHAGVTMALGSFEFQYKREFSNYRKANVTSKITIPKVVGR